MPNPGQEVAGVRCPSCHASAWWNVVAWDVVDQRLRDVMAGTSSL